MEGCALEVAVLKPQKTGYCDRWGYKFTVLTEDDACAVRYHVVRK